MLHSTQCLHLFREACVRYHEQTDLAPSVESPYPAGGLHDICYRKSWIDTVQWHLEDEIRSPRINADRGWQLKKMIDEYNQRRTDLTETLDARILGSLRDIRHQPEAVMNSETPGSILDRLSILQLKVYHMQEEAHRTAAGSRHIEACQRKLEVLREQEEDLSQAFDRLMDDLVAGRKYMKVYYQMKMYNDAGLNPAIYRAARNDPTRTS